MLNMFAFNAITNEILFTLAIMLFVFTYLMSFLLLQSSVLCHCVKYFLIVHLKSFVTSFTIYFLVIFKVGAALVAARLLVFTEIVSCWSSAQLQSW